MIEDLLSDHEPRSEVFIYSHDVLGPKGSCERQDETEHGLQAIREASFLYKQLTSSTYAYLRGSRDSK